MQQKLNERTDKLNAMKNRHHELTRTLDETETHLKQASGKNRQNLKEKTMNVPVRSQNTLEMLLDCLPSSHKIEQLKFDVTVFFSC